MRLIEIAVSQLGKEEVPRGSNWGNDVKKYLNSVGINFPASWCAAYIFWCVNEVCNELHIKNALPKTGGVLMMLQSVAKKYKVLTDPKPGDIFIMDFGHGLGQS